MAYKHTNSKGKTYHLHTRSQPLKGGKTVNLHYFASAPNPQFVSDLPPTHEVTESPRTGLPMLKKKAQPAPPAEPKFPR